MKKDEATPPSVNTKRSTSASAQRRSSTTRPTSASSIGVSVANGQWVVTNPVSDVLGEIQHIEDIATG